MCVVSSTLTETEGWYVQVATSKIVTDVRYRRKTYSDGPREGYFQAHRRSPRPR